MVVTLKTPRTAADWSIDWSFWTPRDRAVLTFVRSGGRLLLIHKKRGLGAGKINAPGGRIEAGETPEAAAVRETQEELGVTPGPLTVAGRLRFAFVNGYSIDCHVFTTATAVGEAVETDEAIPCWCDEHDIPYGRMWSDDRIWLPLLLAQRPFEGWFVFDDDLMLWHMLQVTPAAR